MRVKHGQIVWRNSKVGIRKRKEHGAIDGRIVIPSRRIRLEGVGRVIPCAHVKERRVGDVELRHPSGKSRLSDRRRSHVAVVGSDQLSRTIPLQEDLTAWVREGDAAVLRNSRRAVQSLVPGVQAELRAGNVLS